MKSLKECYEIAKQFHKYWVDDTSKDYSLYMCFAADRAFFSGKLSKEECNELKKDIESLLKAMNPGSSSLGHALYSLGVISQPVYVPDHDVIKEFWDNYIDKMENQDG